jgi:hypothetical protein
MDDIIGRPLGDTASGSNLIIVQSVRLPSCEKFMPETGEQIRPGIFYYLQLLAFIPKPKQKLGDTVVCQLPVTRQIGAIVDKAYIVVIV